MSVYSVDAVTLNATDTLQVITRVTPLEGGAAQNLTTTDLNEQDLNLGSSSTIAITKRCLLYQEIDVTGTFTLDLTAIPDVFLGNQDFSNGGGSSTATASRVQFLKIINQGDNLLKIEPGATSPYYFDAANTAYVIPLPPGASVKFRFAGAANDVLSGASKIKFTGTQGDVVWLLVLGGG